MTLLPPASRSYQPFAQRARDIRKLVDDGHTIPQIAEKLGIGDEQVVALADRAGIDTSAVNANRRTRKHDSNRILEHVVMDAENLTSDVGLIDMSALDRDRLGTWVNDLKSAHRALNRLIVRLKLEMEETDGEGEEGSEGDEGDTVGRTDAEGS